MARITVGAYSQDEWNKHQEQIKAKNELEALYAKADEIDKKTIRPLRAVQAGKGTEEDEQILAVLESEIEAVRAKIDELKKIVGEQT